MRSQRTRWLAVTSPPAVNKDTHHLPAPKEKFKPHLRLPAETEAHQPISENTPGACLANNSSRARLARTKAGFLGGVESELTQ